MRIVALDLSMTATGVAEYSDRWGTTVRTVFSQPERKRKKTDPPLTLLERYTRMSRLRTDVLGWLGPQHIDLVIVEGPSYASVGAGTWDRAGFWWQIVGPLVDAGPVAICPSSNRQKFATGNGRAGKDEVLAAIVRRYHKVPVANNNEADAMSMLAAAMTWLGLPTEPVPKTHSDALPGIQWPEPYTTRREA